MSLFSIKPSTAYSALNLAVNNTKAGQKLKQKTAGGLAGLNKVIGGYSDVTGILSDITGENMDFLGLNTTGAYLQSVRDLQQVEWNTDHLWDIKLADGQGLPAYFKNWLPVIDLEEDVAHINTRDMEFGPTTLPVPEGTHAHSLQLVFLDDTSNSMLNYFSYWMNTEILGGATGRIMPPGDSYRIIYVRKLNRQKEVVETRAYRVNPSGTLMNQGRSQGDLNQYIIKLDIIGSPGSAYGDTDPSTLLGKIGKTVNSVIKTVKSFL